MAGHQADYARVLKVMEPGRTPNEVGDLEEAEVDMLMSAVEPRPKSLKRYAQVGLAAMAFAGCALLGVAHIPAQQVQSPGNHSVVAFNEIPGGPLELTDECKKMGCDWIAKYRGSEDSPAVCLTPADTKVYRCCCAQGVNTQLTGLLSLKDDETSCITVPARDWEDDLIDKPLPMILHDNATLGACQYGNRNMEFDAAKWGQGVIRLANEARKCLGMKAGTTAPGSPISLSFCGRGEWLGTNMPEQQWKFSAEIGGKIQWVSNTSMCMDLRKNTGLTLETCDNKSSTQTFMMRKQKAPGKADDPSLFCAALMMPFGYEVEITKAQAKAEVGIFGCDEFAVYSNKSISIAPNFTTNVMEGSLDAPRGGKYNTVMNTGVFRRWWAAVVEDKRSQSHPWTVKVDPDAVFFATRLKELLRETFQPSGVAKKAAYINNCYLGLHGPIEVVTKEALAVYKEKAADCDGDAEEHGQEDAYLRHCMKTLDVEKVDAFNILYEEGWACNERDSTRDTRPPCFSHQVSFHPYKTAESYFDCYRQADSQKWVLPLYPIKEEPASYNFHHA